LNTEQQVEHVREMLAQGLPGPSAVLVSQLQYPRVAAFLSAARLEVLLVPGPLDEPLPASGPLRWIPSLGALATTRDTLYELAAIYYYGDAQPTQGR
jgi:hypothetical protein